jgi:acetyltransferase
MYSFYNNSKMEILNNFFNPSSIALIGASRFPGKVGYEILKNILNSGFKGKIYPINPNAEEIFGLKSFKSILDIPEKIDLSIIAIPSKFVPEVLKECGENGNKASIIISAGFKEIGPEGLSLEKKLIDIAHEYGIRILGPNCLGIIDTYTPLNASFSANMPPKGNVAFISQSGALLTAVLDWALLKNFGFSKIISMGNKADINEIDLLNFLGNDPYTKAILLYVEGIDKGKEFLKIAKENIKKKPIVIIKAGISEKGSRAVSSHTGALAGSSIAYEIAFKQTGILKASSIEEIFIKAEALSKLSIPKSEEVFIITNAGGPGVLATDACEKYGLKISEVDSELADQLRSFLPLAASLHNPIDVLGDAKAETYEKTIETLIRNKKDASFIIILTPQAMTEPEETAKRIIEISKKYPSIAIATVFMGGVTIEKARQLLLNNGIPCFEYPEQAVLAISTIIDYKRILDKPIEKKIEEIKIDKSYAEKIIKKVRNEGRTVLLGIEANELINSYGIPTPQSFLATNVEEAIEFAEKIGFPIVMKISSPNILHKTDIGGVKLNINSLSQLKEAFNEIINNAVRFFPEAEIYGIEIYKQYPRGKEVIIGMTKDPQFGPLIMFGAGGIYANFIKDVSFRFPPLSKEDIYEMISETKIYNLLRGVRGEKPSDLDALIDIILRFSKLVMDFEKDLADIDINPIFVYEKGNGCIAIDVKISIIK